MNKILKKIACWIFGHEYVCIDFKTGYFCTSEYKCKKCNAYKKYRNF